MSETDNQDIFCHQEEVGVDVDRPICRTAANPF